MRMYDIIEKKRDGYSLTKKEIDFFVQGYTEGLIPDYQASALWHGHLFSRNDRRGKSLSYNGHGSFRGCH